jgi:murein DD-endopeptidase MepM/ murein hydrolase activator NlpD
MKELSAALLRNRPSFHPLVNFDPQHDKLIKLDFSAGQSEPKPAIFSSTELFSIGLMINSKITERSYGIGGYGELRTVYGMSNVFDAAQEGEEPRRFHIGMDIWGKAGTPVFAPLGGMVHSFAFNDRKGDYGATIILLHQLDGIPFYSLYGHLAFRDLSVSEGNYINRGQEFAHFGDVHENGHWPPHLHLQLIFDIEMKKGDYPGVCKYSEREKYLANCPDPDFLANLNQFV